MSCQNCNDAQDDDRVAYYRWKNATIQIDGCAEHLKEIFDALNETQKEQK